METEPSTNIQVVASAPAPVPAPDTTPPSVSITSPADGAVVSRNSLVSITATASDNTAVTKVEFLINGNLKCTDTTANYSCSFRAPRKAGVTRSIQVKAYDAAGNVSSSKIVKISTR